jgi:hypothetical protein
MFKRVTYSSKLVVSVRALLLRCDSVCVIKSSKWSMGASYSFETT